MTCAEWDVLMDPKKPLVDITAAEMAAMVKHQLSCLRCYAIAIWVREMERPYLTPEKLKEIAEMNKKFFADPEFGETILQRDH